MNQIKNTQYFCFMDYETTGLETMDRIDTLPIQIGCVFTDNEFTNLAEYVSYIKWDELAGLKQWPESMMHSYKVHRIGLDTLEQQGKTRNEIISDVNAIINEKMDITTRRPVVISDAPNFEMYWTEFVWGTRTKKGFPFHYNAWSIYPTLQLFGIEYKVKPHDALDDARIMWKGMKQAYHRAKEINSFKAWE